MYWQLTYIRPLVTDDTLRTQPLGTIPDGQQPAVATSAPSQPATRDGTYQGLYQTIPEVRQNDGAYEMIPPAEGTQGDRSEMPYANTRQYENTRRAWTGKLQYTHDFVIVFVLFYSRFF